MTPDKMQSSRFELKYVIDEATALRMRDFARCYLDPDQYARKQPDFSYPVHSIYLDSDDLYTYRTTTNGDRNRFKLRVRFYDDDPRNPVFSRSSGAPTTASSSSVVRCDARPPPAS